MLKGALGMTEDDISHFHGLNYSKDAGDARRVTAPSLRLGAISLRSAAAAALLPRSVGNVAGARRCREYPAGPVVKIYTRKGDDGSTGLWYGGRVPKSGGRPEAYGAVDEAASALGLCRAAATSADEELATDILRIQNELFVAGAELATAPEASERLEAGVSKVTSEMALIALAVAVAAVGVALLLRRGEVPLPS